MKDSFLTIKIHPQVQRAMLLLPRWITPNGVTVFGALLTVPTMACLFAGRYWTALSMFFFASSLDFVDGSLARARGMESETGAFLDPLADKARTWGVFIPLLWLAPDSFGWLFVPTVLFGLFIAVSLTAERIRKLRLAAQGTHASKTAPSDRPNRPSIAANSFGKQKTVVESSAAIIAMSGFALESTWLIFIGFTVLTASLYFAYKSFEAQLWA